MISVAVNFRDYTCGEAGSGTFRKPLQNFIFWTADKLRSLL